MRVNVSILLLLWYVNIRLNRFSFETLPVTLAREAKRTESMCRYAGCLQSTRPAIVKSLQSCLNLGPWVLTLPCIGFVYSNSELHNAELIREIFAEATVPPGCVMRKSLCIDVPAALPSTREILYWLLSPLFFVPETLTGNGLVMGGVLAGLQVMMFKFFGVLCNFMVKQALIHGKIHQADVFMCIYDIMYSWVWGYVMGIVYFSSFTTWGEEQILLVGFIRNMFYFIPTICMLAYVTSPRRESTYLLSKTARLEIVEKAVIFEYKENIKILDKLSDHALLEVSQKLFKTTKLPSKDKKQVMQLLKSRPKILGVLNFWQVTSESFFFVHHKLAMSMKLRELIRQVRAAKSQTEERSVVAKESANIRDSFKAGENSYRHRNIAKLLYFHLLGYPSSFGQMECVKLCASSKFSEKRIGYLALSLLLDSESEILFLVTNSVKQDLVSSDEFAASAALSLLGNCATAEMALAPQIFDLLLHPNPNLKKKAIIASVRLSLFAPDDTDKFFFRILSLLDSSISATTTIRTLSTHSTTTFASQGTTTFTAGPGGVTLAVCSALESLIAVRPSLADNFPLGSVARLLRRVQQAGAGGGEFEFPGGVTDPFVQVALLRLIRKVLLASGSAGAHIGSSSNGSNSSSNVSTSEGVLEILASTCTNTESTKNPGCAILYECAMTILEISTDPTLRTLAINVLGKFLSTTLTTTSTTTTTTTDGEGISSNMTYVGLLALQSAALSDEKAVQRHRSTIIQCLNDADLSIRRRALEICVRLTNEANFKSVSRELLNHLSSATDAGFKADLVAKIAGSAAKFATDQRQYVDVVLKLCKLAGLFISDVILNGLIALLSNTSDHNNADDVVKGKELQKYILIQVLNEVRSTGRDARDGLLTLAVHAVGEWGELVEVPAAELLEVLEDAARLGLLQGQGEGGAARSGVTLCQAVATALAKLGAKLPKEYEPRISGILRKFENSLHPEVQQRACEYLALAQMWPGRRSLIDKLSAGRAPMVLSQRPVGEVSLSDLAVSAKVASGAAKEKLDIDDLLGDSTGGRRVVASGADSLLDILGEIAPVEGGELPTRRILEKAVVVELSGRGSGARLELRTTFTKFDWATEPVDNLVFEVAVPRYLRLTMRPASGAALPAAEARITQDFVLENTEQDKPVIFKFRLSYSQGGKQVLETGQVAPLS